MKAKEIISKYKPCKSAMDWLGDRTVEQMVNECPRGDWLLWLACKLELDLKTMTLAKVKCARTVQHLMKDERSLNALDVAEKFTNREATIDDMSAAAANGAADYYAAAADAAYSYAGDAGAADAAAAYATYAYSAYADAAADGAVDAYSAYSYAAYGYADAAAYCAADGAADAAADGAGDGYYAARKENLKQTADICREVFGEWIIDELSKTQ